MEKKTQEKIGQMQMIEQNLQQLLSQKQQFQLQLAEVGSAQKELKSAKRAYRIVGNIMVDARPEELSSELDSKKKMLDMRVSAIEKQEERLSAKSKELQEIVLGEIEDGSKQDDDKKHT